MAARKSDYKIISFYSTLDPDVEKFKIMHGGMIQSVYSDYESAASAVNNLLKDPWFFDRGQTKADRSNW